MILHNGSVSVSQTPWAVESQDKEGTVFSFLSEFVTGLKPLNGVRHPGYYSEPRTNNKGHCSKTL